VLKDEKEAQLEAITALSGSGPAYVFLLMKVLRQGGKESGLTKDLAERFAIQTVLGAKKLAMVICETRRDYIGIS